MLIQTVRPCAAVVTMVLSLATLLLAPGTAYGQEQSQRHCEIDPVPWLESIGFKDGLFLPCDCIDSKPNCRVSGANATEPSSTNAGLCSTCGLDDGMQVLVNLSQLILAVTGSAALLMFTYGGAVLIFSSGNTNLVDRGKMVIKSAVIGLVLVLSAWVIVNFTINAVTGGEVGSEALLFKTHNWSDSPDSAY